MSSETITIGGQVADSPLAIPGSESAHAGARTQRVDCDICGGSESQVVFPADAKCGPIVKCNACGLVYSNPRDIVQYHDRRSHSGYRAQIPGKRKAFEYRLRQLEQFKPKGKLLEIGSHHGLFLDVAQKRGWDVLGIEPDANGCEWGHKEFGVETLPRYFPGDVDLPGNSFDAVVFFNVLEHLTSPTEALIKARHLLRPEGIIFLEIPYIFTMWVKTFGKRWFHFEPTHYYYYSEATIEKLLKKTGFKLLRLEFLPKFMNPVTVVTGFSNHFRLVRFLRSPATTVLRKMGLEDRYFTLRSKNFLSAIAQKE